MIADGKYVVVHYKGTLDDGEVFDSTFEDGMPLEFKLGSGMVIPGFENAIRNMNINDETEITLTPENAYGEYSTELQYRIPLEEVKKQFIPEEGMMLRVQLDNGQDTQALIKEVTDTEVVMDLNHVLAGKTLHFHLKLVEINDEAKYDYSCGCDDDDCDCKGGDSCGCGDGECKH